MDKMIAHLSTWLKPDLRKVLCTILMLALLIAAYIQSYAFVDDMPGTTKPPLYDLLHPFDFWVPAMLLIMPMALLSVPLQGLGFSPFSASLVWPLQILYVYFLSCLLIFGHDRWGARLEKKWRWLVWLLPFFVIIALWMPAMLAGLGFAWQIIPYIVSTIFFSACVLSLYLYVAVCVGIGIYKALPRMH
ncbi:MAG: hypothetical protein ACUVR2_06715 [Anaerolineae bacterium]